MALSKGSKVFLVALLFLGGGVVGLGAFMMTGAGGDRLPDGTEVSVHITEGMGAGQVAELLEEEGVIRSASAFRFSARGDDRAGRIQPGIYELVAGMSHSEILDILSVSPEGPPTFRVTIPEGLTVEQTLARIAGAEGSPFSEEELRAALDGVALPEFVPADLPEGAEPFEGLLFPDTYDFRADSDPQQVLGRLVRQTESVLESIEPSPDLSRYETLVLASLIEREARLRDEQRMISAVMHNRLEIGMALQIDATVLYALGEHRERVLYEDLEVDSPWNTYRYPGIPPTPISGAGRAAIEAAADPTDDEYLYYVVVDPETGEHGFSTTLEEHNRKRREAQQG